MYSLLYQQTGFLEISSNTFSYPIQISTSEITPNLLNPHDDTTLLLNTTSLAVLATLIIFNFITAKCMHSQSWYRTQPAITHIKYNKQKT